MCRAHMRGTKIRCHGIKNRASTLRIKVWSEFEHKCLVSRHLGADWLIVAGMETWRTKHRGVCKMTLCESLCEKGSSEEMISLNKGDEEILKPFPAQGSEMPRILSFVTHTAELLCAVVSDCFFFALLQQPQPKHLQWPHRRLNERAQPCLLWSCDHVHAHVTVGVVSITLSKKCARHACETSMARHKCRVVSCN